MKPAPFAFARPATLEEAVALLAGEANAKVLAGGQSLVPLLSMRLAAPSMLVDINAIPELDAITVDESGVRVGALVRHADLLADDSAARAQPLIRQGLANVAHATIRNRGTTVGSLVHADAAAEMPAVLALVGGTVTVAGPNGRREILADELYVGPLESSLHHDEIAVDAFFPRLADGHGTACLEVARRHGDYAMCGVAVDVAGDLSSVRASYISVSEVPTVIDLTDALGGRDDEASLTAAGEVALGRLDPQEDIHASVAYRSQLIRVLTARAIKAAIGAGRRGAL